MLTRHKVEYHQYLRSASWRRHRAVAFLFWGALWACAVAGAVYEHAPLAVIAALVCLAVGKHDGHHWRTHAYAHLGHERPWDVLPVSRRVNWFENVLHKRLKMGHVPATVVALVVLGPLPVWLYLAVTTVVGL